MLQTKTLNSSSAMKNLSKTPEFVETSRKDDASEKMLVDARGFVADLDIPTTFEELQYTVWKKKRLFTYEGQHDPIENPKEKFKVGIYFPILDIAMTSVKEPFGQLEELDSNFGLLYNIDALEDKATQTVLEHCVNFEEALTHNQSQDIDWVELRGKIQVISRWIKKQSTPKDVLDLILESYLDEASPNFYTALQISLTLPVSVASGERRFSKLKLIKPMTQERLVRLASTFFEHEIAQTIELNGFVEAFAKKKATKQRLV